jgi:hypothetical protein
VVVPTNILAVAVMDNSHTGDTTSLIILVLLFTRYFSHVVRPGFRQSGLYFLSNPVSSHRRIKLAPTSASPDTAKASVKGVLSLRSSIGDAAAVDCCAGGVPDDEAALEVEAEAEIEADVDAEAEAGGATEPLPVVDSSELGIGVSPGGIPIEPSDVTPPFTVLARRRHVCRNGDGNAHMGGRAP